MRVGITKFQRRIQDLKAFDPEKVNDRRDPGAEALEVSIDQTLMSVFGADSADYKRYRSAVHLDRAGYNMYGTPLNEVREGFEKGKIQAMALLEQAARSLAEELADQEQGVTAPTDHARPTSVDITNVFVVHGRDDAAKNDVARFISKTGLTPIILHEQASVGMTVIEKLERYSNVGFAVVILTPDDIGGEKGTESFQPRARQNVIAELFYFVGKLGRPRVCALKKGDLDIPSDIGGVVYINLDDRGAWRTELLRELEAAGYKVDWGKALR